MSFQTRFVSVRNTNEDLFSEIWEISVLPLSTGNTSFKSQKGSVAQRWKVTNYVTFSRVT